MKKIYVIPEIEITKLEMYQIMMDASIANGDAVTNENGDYGDPAPNLFDFGDDDVDW